MSTIKLQVRADSVGWGDDPEKVIEQYLPRGYRVTGTVDGFVQIEGEDFAGWTAQDYVIPRLASGMIYATVVE